MKTKNKKITKRKQQQKKYSCTLMTTTTTKTVHLTERKTNCSTSKIIKQNEKKNRKAPSEGFEITNLSQ